MMKSSKHLVSLLLAAVMSLLLCACTESENNTNKTSNTGNTNSASDTAASSAEPTGSKDGESKADTAEKPEWLTGSWSYMSSKQSYRITLKSDHTLLWEAVYYSDNNGLEMTGNKTGVDYGYEREYTYDPSSETVVIQKYDTSGITGAIYQGEAPEGYTVKVVLSPDKDRDGRSAAMFTLGPKDIDGPDSSEFSKLRYKRTEG